MDILVGAACVAQGEKLREKQCVCYMLDPDTDGKKKIFQVLLCTVVFCFSQRAVVSQRGSWFSG